MPHALVQAVHLPVLGGEGRRQRWSAVQYAMPHVLARPSSRGEECTGQKATRKRQARLPGGQRCLGLI